MAQGHRDVQQHVEIADVAVLAQVRILDRVEHVPVAGVACDQMGGLAGQRAGQAAGVFEILGAHAFDIDAGLVLMAEAGFPMAQDHALARTIEPKT